MSVCFFVPAADGGGASTSAEDAQETETTVEDKRVETLDLQLQQFWAKTLDDVKKCSADHFKTQALPLARIKKIMKLDEEVKMISSEAPILFAKAAEIFIHELTLRAWAHTEDNKRRTLQRNDIAMAIAKSDQFDFLIDIVPRQEMKPVKRDDPPRSSTSNETQYYHQSSSSSQQQPQQHVSQSQPGVYATLTPTSSGQQSSNAAGMQQSLALVQHVTPSGEVQQLPIQLTPGQLNMIRLQMQNNPNQPIIIQQAQQTPQIIQVTSQAPQQTQQVFLAQLSQQDTDS